MNNHLCLSSLIAINTQRDRHTLTHTELCSKSFSIIVCVCLCTFYSGAFLCAVGDLCVRQSPCCRSHCSPEQSGWRRAERLSGPHTPSSSSEPPHLQNSHSCYAHKHRHVHIHLINKQSNYCKNWASSTASEYPTHVCKVIHTTWIVHTTLRDTAHVFVSEWHTGESLSVMPFKCQPIKDGSEMLVPSVSVRNGTEFPKLH